MNSQYNITAITINITINIFENRSREHQCGDIARRCRTRYAFIEIKIAQ